MQGPYAKNAGKRLSYGDTPTPSSVPPLPPLAQEVLDIAAKTLLPIEAYFLRKDLQERYLLEQLEAAIALSLRPEIEHMSREGTLYAYFRFWSSDQCEWLGKYKAYCKKKKKRQALRIHLLTVNDFRILRETMAEFYQSFATKEPLPLLDVKVTKLEEEPFPAALPVVEDHIRTGEEWMELRAWLGELANQVDPLVCGKTGQDYLWADAVYDEILNLGQQCSPRYLQMAWDTWGIVATWQGERYEITDEYERISFSKMVDRAIWREQRQQEQEQSTQVYLQWMQEQERIGDVIKERLTKRQRKEKSAHESEGPKQKP